MLKSLLLILLMITFYSAVVECRKPSHRRRLSGEANAPAYLNLTTTSSNILIISIRNAECYKCKLIEVAQINIEQSKMITIDTRLPAYYFFISNRMNSDLYCPELAEKSTYFGENGTYALSIDHQLSTNDTFKCKLITIKEPDNIYEPIYIAIAVLAGAGLIYALSKLFYKKVLKKCIFNRNDAALNQDLGAPILTGASTYITQDLDTSSALSSSMKQVTKIASSNRMKSVDVLRGLALAIMIFANYGSGDYIFLDHSAWNGLHLADTVFPAFIFIMGISIPFAFRSFSSRSSSINRNDSVSHVKVSTILKKILKRTCLLFFFGLLVSNESGKHLSHLRIMGVLQRFAISYFVIAIIELIYFKMNNFNYPNPNEQSSLLIELSRFKKLKLMFIEIFYYPLQWFIVIVLATIWLVLTFLLSVDGCPTGYLGPGGLHENASFFNCTGGAAGYIDRMIMGVNHMYDSPTCNDLYFGIMPYDPEGLLGTLNSCILAYLGVSTGHIIIHYKSVNHRLGKFIFYSFVYGLVAMALCNFSQNEGVIPVNKNLWSLSYILLIAGMTYLALAIMYILVDVKTIYSGTPFLYLGRNSITIYICHEIFINYFPFFEVDNTHAWLLAKDLYGVCLWCLLAALMNYNKVFISL